ncbi:hypothetical protein PTKU46_15730 [Paraburkholderia terrae]
MAIGQGRRNKAVVRHKRRRHSKTVVRHKRPRSKEVVRRVKAAILLGRRLRTREDAHPGRRPCKAVAVPPGHLKRRLLRVLRDRRPARAADIRPGLRAAVATPGRHRLQGTATKARITDYEAVRGLLMHYRPLRLPIGSDSAPWSVKRVPPVMPPASRPRSI